MTRPRLSLPAGYALERELARRPDVSVVLARRGQERVVLRLETAGGESLAELAVLAAVRHPALARLVDHGPLPGGGRFVARPYVEGRELGELAGEATPAELGRLVGRVARGVAHLHARGFVHGDLKPANVVVTPEGRPVLIDFGLATGLDAGEASAAGTPFFVAPERLVGRTSDARADVFSLGAMLVALLARPQVDARQFYGRFPAESFLDAAEVRLDDLPEWARDLVPTLLDRDPTRRPNAAWVASLLGARLGDPPDAPERASLELDWPPLEGHEAFLVARQRAWGKDDDRRVETWLFASAREARRTADAAALDLALRGRSVRLLDLPREVDGLNNGVELDRWARESVALEGTTTFVAFGLGDSAWRRRALAGLASTIRQAVRQGRARARGHRLVVCRGRDEAPPPGLETLELEFPSTSEAGVLARLRSWLPDADESALATLAERLHAESRGSTVRLDELTRSLVEEGWILAGANGALRLRSGVLPSHLGRSTTRGAGERTAALDAPARRALGALMLADTPLDVVELTRRTALAPDDLARSIGKLRHAGLVGVDAEARIRLASPLQAESGVLDDASWRALHAAAAADPGLAPWRRALHRWRSELEEEPGRERFLVALHELRERGAAELVLEAVRFALGTPGGRRDDPLLLVERARAWADLGMSDLANRELAGLDGLADPRVRARASLVRAQVARLRGDLESAREEARRAGELEPALAPYVALDEVRADYEAGRNEAAAAVLAELEGRDLPPTVRLNLDTYRALLAFRRGEVELAREGLTATSRALARSDAPGLEAAALLNLAVVERHVGRLAEAERLLHRAEELVTRDGHPGRLTQVQTVLGAVQRDRGALEAAERTLVTAVEARERLGDSAGADRARGVLGLTLLERGRPRAALALLEGALPRVGPAERAWLAASAEECRARIGLAVRLPETAPEDPRVALSLARAAGLAGETARAVSLAAAAESRATTLGRPSLAAAARAARAWLEGGPVDAEGDAAADARACLTRAPFEASAVLARARTLVEQGRDGHAARLALAVSARAEADTLRRQARHLAREALDRCAIGLSSEEAQALRHTLLGLPDPCPEDLAALDEEDLDMDVLKLLEINQHLVDQEDLARLLGVIVEQALEVTGAHRGFLVLEEDGELSLDLALDTRRGDIDEPDVELSHSVVRRALEDGEALRLSNAAEDPVLGHAPSVEALELRSVLCQPFTVTDDLRGVIYVDNRLEEGTFDQRAERLLGLLAGQATLAIRQVRRLEEIRRLNFELEREVVHKETDLQAAQRALAEQGAPVPVRGLVGESQAMQRVHDLLRRIAPAALPVLVTGPSGSGKELAARALHDLSPRAEGPFVPENCAALPATIIEAELFGYVKGAFTGADRDRAGLFERASGGTLFLDEIGELGIELQAKLLRVLETRVVRRVGGTSETTVDFRLVAATNRDLAEEVNAGRFREDLMYRLDAVRVEMPPLAARTVDIPALVDHFLRLQRARDGIARRCSTEVLRALMAREWPGNVRELANEIARLCVLSDGDLLDPGLVREVRATAPDAAPPCESGAIVPIADLEKRAILRAIEVTSGDKKRAAELLGISRAKVYQRLKEWGEA